VNQEGGRSHQFDGVEDTLHNITRYGLATGFWNYGKSHHEVDEEEDVGVLLLQGETGVVNGGIIFLDIELDGDLGQSLDLIFPVQGNVIVNTGLPLPIQDEVTDVPSADVLVPVHHQQLGSLDWDPHVVSHEGKELEDCRTAFVIGVIQDEHAIIFIGEKPQTSPDNLSTGLVALWSQEHGDDQDGDVQLHRSLKVASFQHHSFEQANSYRGLEALRKFRFIGMLTEIRTPEVVAGLVATWQYVLDEGVC
jgi:hypothetical protein